MNNNKTLKIDLGLRPEIIVFLIFIVCLIRRRKN